MKNNAPFLTPNPQDFKLRIVWSADGSTKMVAEFSSCKWLPRIGETLVLPIDETRKPDSWRKFKVFDVVYDFQNQTVRVLCSPIKSSMPKAEKPLDRWEIWEKALVTSEETTKANLQRFQAQLEYEISQLDADDEFEKLAIEIKETIRRSLE